MAFLSYRLTSNATVPAYGSYTANTNGTTLTVTAVSSGTLEIGSVIKGTGIPVNTYITALGSGTGGTGTYSLNQAVTSNQTGINVTVVARLKLTGLTNEQVDANFKALEDAKVERSGDTITGTLNIQQNLNVTLKSTLEEVDINAGVIDNVSIGSTTAATYLKVDNIVVDGNTISSNNTDGNITIAPNGAGDVYLDADTVRVGDSGAAATIVSNGAGNLTIKTGAANTGSITLAQGTDGNITIEPHGAGDVYLNADTVRVGDADAAATILSNGAGDLTIKTGAANTGSIILAQGTDGNITIEPHGAGDVYLNADTVRVGDSGSAATIISNGAGDLTIKTGAASTGSIVLTQGTNGNISLTPNGTGSVVLPKVDIGGGEIDAVTIGTNSVVTELRVDSIKVDSNVVSSLQTSQTGTYVVASGSLTIATITSSSHGLSTGDSVTVTYTATTGTKPTDGTYSVTVVDANTYTITYGVNQTASTGNVAITNPNTHIVIAPNAGGDVYLDADTVRVGDSGSTATIVSNGAGNLIIKTGAAATGSITLAQGVNGNITIATNGDGDVYLDADTIRVGDSDAAATIVSNGAGNLTIKTGAANTGSIVLAQGANGNISVTPDGTGSVVLPKVDIGGGEIDAVTIGTNSAVTDLRVDNIKVDGNTISSTDTNGNITIAPNGSGQVLLDSDVVRVGDSGAAATILSNGAGNLTIKTGATDTGTIVLTQGTNGNVTITPHGTGQVLLDADTVRVGDSGSAATIISNGAGNLTIKTGAAATGSIVLTQGTNGNISITPDGTGAVVLPKVDIGGGEIDAVTIGTNSVVTELRVDSIKVDSNVVSSLQTSQSGTYTVLAGSLTLVTITSALHGLSTGDNVTVTYTATTGTKPTDGTYSVTVVDSNTYTITYGSNQTASTGTVAITNPNTHIVIAPNAGGDVYLDADTVRVGDSGATANIVSNGNNNLVIRTGSANTGSITLGQGTDGNITIEPHGAGDVYLNADTVRVGDAGSAATIVSNGAGDLTIKTGSTNTGTITITQGDNGNVTVSPHGTGQVLLDADTVRVGDAGSAATIVSNGAGDLTIKTGAASTGTIALAQGANGNITVTPNGTGVFNIKGSTATDDSVITLGGLESTVDVTKDKGLEFKWNGTVITLRRIISTGTTTVTATVPNTTGYSFGDYITISGATGTEQTKLNGTVKIASVISTSISITSYTGAGTTTVTAAIPTDIGHATGDTITISGAVGTEQAKLNGTWTITRTSATAFTFVVSSAVAVGALTTNIGTTTVPSITFSTATALTSGSYITNLGTAVKSKNGFFGLDQSTGKLTFIPQADNSSEVFSGTAGAVEFGSAEFKANTSSTSTTTGTVIITGGLGVSESINSTSVTATTVNATTVNAGNVRATGNTISSTDTNGNLTIAPNGSGQVLLDSDVVRVGDSGVAATIVTNGAGNLTIKTGATNTGSITLNQGSNGDISITPHGTGSVVIPKIGVDRIRFDATSISTVGITSGITYSVANSSTSCVITSTAHGFNGGELVQINFGTASTGNDLTSKSKQYVIGAVTTDTFTITLDAAVTAASTGAITSITDINLILAPVGNGDVYVDADTLRIGDGAATATVISNGAGNLVLKTGSTNTGVVTITQGDNGNILLDPHGTGVVQTSKIDINGGTIDGVTIGTNSVVTDLRVDNIQVDGNTISSTDANGNISITPNGTGSVVLSKVDIGAGEIDGVTIGTNSVVTDLRVDNIKVDGNTISSTDTNGNISITPNGTGSVVLSKVDIGSGEIDGVTIGTNSAVTDLRVDNIKVDGNTISSTDTNGNISIAPNGTGDVYLDADTVRVGDSDATANIVSNGNNNLVIKTGATDTGSITLAQGTDGNITIAPHGAGDVYLDADTIRVGDSGAAATIVSNGTNDLTLKTGAASTGSITLAQGANGNITIAPHGSGDVYLDADTVRVGDVDAAATIVSNGTGNLTIKTGATDTGSITLAQGANGNITIAPHGSGDVYLDADTIRVGDVDAAATIVSNGTGDLTLKTGSTNTGTVTIAQGDNANITLTPHGTGTVNISKLNATGGTINGITIGTITRSTGAFTTLDANGNVILGSDSSDTLDVNALINTNLLFAAGKNIGAINSNKPNNLYLGGDAVIDGKLTVIGNTAFLSQSISIQSKDFVAGEFLAKNNVYGIVTSVAGSAAPYTATVKAVQPEVIKGETLSKISGSATLSSDARVTNIAVEVYSLSGTYSCSSTTGTITINGHNLLDGDTVNLTFTTGTGKPVDGSYVISNATTNTFTITLATASTATGNVTLTKGQYTLTLTGSSAFTTGSIKFATSGPTNYSADQGGLTLRASLNGATDKYIRYNQSTNSWISSENLELLSTKNLVMNTTSETASETYIMADLSSAGTYTVSASTNVTITKNAHGLSVGDVVTLAFTQATGTKPADGTFTVTSVTTNTYNVTVAASTTATGNATITNPIVTVGPTFDSTKFRSVEFTVQVKRGSAYRTSKILSLYDGSTSDHTEHSILKLGSFSGVEPSFDVAIVNSRICLRSTVGDNTATTFKIVAVALKD